MDAVITAGGIPRPDEALYIYTQGQPKALLEINGKPMLQWVLDALNDSKAIHRIIIIGLPSELPNLRFKKPITFLPSAGDMMQNMRQASGEVLRGDPQARHFLSVCSDVPGITTEMVDWAIQQVESIQTEVHYFVVQKQVMEARYPGSKRTYTKLKDVEICGADVSAIDPTIFQRSSPVWLKLFEARKNPLRQAMIIGLDTLFLIATRQLTLEQTAKQVTQRLNLTGKAILSPYAELGMDVDKPFQYDLMCKDLTAKGQTV